jgi:hypothetical protein
MVDDSKGDEPLASNKQHVRMSSFSAKDIRRTAEFQVISSELYTMTISID